MEVDLDIDNNYLVVDFVKVVVAIDNYIVDNSFDLNKEFVVVDNSNIVIDFVRFVEENNVEYCCWFIC